MGAFLKWNVTIKNNIMNNWIEKINKNLIGIISIAISVSACFVSIQSCCNSKKAITISEYQGIPFLQITEIKLKESIKEASFITVDITIKNLGQIPATDVSIEMDYGKEIFTHGNNVTNKKIGGIGQGSEERVVLVSNRRNMRDWKTRSYRNYETLYFYGTIFYRDKFNDREKKIDWCYELPLNNENSLSDLTLIKSEYGKYESDYDIERQ